MAPDSFLQAARLAEDRVAEVAAAIASLKADNDAWRETLEARLGQRYEERRERLLLSAVQTLETLDGAIDAARDGGAAEPLIAGVMLVRTQLFRILQEEGLERVSVLGQPYDPGSSELVRRRPVEDRAQEGMVVEELQGGHQLRGHVVRRAKVVVGEYEEEVSQPTAAMPAADEPDSALPAAALPAVAEAGGGASEDTSGDDPGGVTMVLEDSAAVLVRPPPAVPPPALIPPAAARAGAAATAVAPAPQWEAAHWKGGDPNQTQPVPRESRVAMPPPEARAAEPPPPVEPPVRRVRTATAFSEPPTESLAPAWRPPEPPRPGRAPSAATAPAGRGRRLYAGLSLVIVVLAVAMGIEIWMLRRRAPPAVVPTAAPPASSLAIEEDVTVVKPTQAAGPSPSPQVASAETTPGRPLPPVAAPTSLPAAPARPAGAPTAAPAVTQPAPTPVPRAPATTLPANPVPGLVAQAEQAEAARNYEEAIARYDEALKAEPGNAEAAAGRLRAAGARAAAGRFFKTVATVRDVGSEARKPSKSVAGFDGIESVAEKRDYDCKIDYRLDPRTPQQGQPYSVEVSLTNTGKKDFKVQAITGTVSVNGTAAPHPVTPLAREVARGQKAAVGRLEDVWATGTTGWWLEVAVRGPAGDTYRAQLTWELQLH